MANLDFTDKISKSSERLKSLEQIGGLGLLQPFNTTNSGARKILASTQRQQIFSLMQSEMPILGTGFDNSYGDYSSSVVKADSDYRVIAKISKFSFAPQHHYLTILENLRERKLDVRERICYTPIRESYGYLNNNSKLDSLNIGDIVPENTILKESLAFDEYHNRCDGVNLNVVYMALDQNMEDSVIISDAAAKKMTSPLIKPVPITINENDIPLNIYGNSEVYKSFPDIGEKIRDDGNLICLRKEKKEEAFYMQSVDRLTEPLMTDDKRILKGTVVDININCNKPEYMEDNIYYEQFKLYYDELQRYSAEIVSMITPYVANGYELSYDLEKIFGIAKRVLNKDQYIEKNNRPFSFMTVEIVVLEELELEVGDKCTNMYGSKGVISKIVPQYLMPKMSNNEYVDIILNSSTMYNRENPGQIFETSINHIGRSVLELISNGVYDENEAFDLICDFIECVSPSHAAKLRNWGERLVDTDKAFYVQSVVNDGCIRICVEPLTETFTIDKLADMYDKFPTVEQCGIEVPITDSNGNIRYITARRKMTIGKQYIFRLKQFAEEKFMATSLSATNIRGENTKSKASRDYKEMHSNTPIRKGNMEIEDEIHLGTEHVVTNLMIHSVSPEGRQLTEQFYTGDPFNVDIKLDNNSSNRQAEILNTYLKTMGLRLKFLKVPKKQVPAVKFPAIYFREDYKKDAVYFVKDEEELEKRKNKKKNAVRFEAIRFYE